ncbi:alpha/beta fold hydrolase [Roseiarcus fermentans]|uniref:alpha/beta fold hydrolase n=1 Tax=Roseiarcus fermentans TaxID=1473586 RepID=UPI001AECBFEF|nr:alpha/beta hydrolase [Roseiarcus fermentans]
MKWILEAAAALVALEVALAALAVLAAWGIERAAPPQGRYLVVGGVKLHLVDQGRGPPVVLIHGLAGQIGHFAHSLIRRLTDGFRVVAFDRPGSGYSAPSPGGIREQAAILARAIRALKLGQPLVVGHSLGGAVALALALDHPDCVGGLALIAPATHPLAEAPALFRSLVIHSRLLRGLYAWTAAGPAALIARPTFFRAAFAPEPAPADFGTAGGGLLALRPGNLYVTSTELTAGLSDEAVETMPGRYGSLTIPVGILYGRDDRILDWRSQGEAMTRELPSLDLELVDGGHMLPVTQPDVCARFIRRIASKMPAL